MDDCVVGEAGRSRRRSRGRRTDHKRAGGTGATAPGEQPTEDGAGDPRKSRGLVRAGDHTELEEHFEFVRANQDTYPVGVLCRLLRVSKYGFYAWMERP